MCKSFSRAQKNQQTALGGWINRTILSSRPHNKQVKTHIFNLKQKQNKKTGLLLHGHLTCFFLNTHTRIFLIITDLRERERKREREKINVRETSVALTGDQPCLIYMESVLGSIVSGDSHLNYFPNTFLQKPTFWIRECR